MLIVEIDSVDAESLQRSFAGLSYVLRLAVHSKKCAGLRIAHVSELGGDDDLIAPSLDCAPDQLFVGVRAVYVGGIEQVDPQLDSAVDGGNRLLVVARSIKIGHSHAAKSDRRGMQALRAESAGLGRYGSGGRGGDVRGVISCCVGLAR